MAFKKGQSGNPNGRPTADRLVSKTHSNKEIREKELKQILRRLKPLNSKVISEFEKMFMSETITEAGKVKLGVFLLKTYTDLIDDVYKDTTLTSKQNDEDDDDEKTLAPIVSLKVVN